MYFVYEGQSPLPYVRKVNSSLCLLDYLKILYTKRQTHFVFIQELDSSISKNQ